MKTAGILGILLIALTCGEVGAQTTKTAGPFPIVTWHQWNQLSDGEKKIYTEGFLETLSFQFYAYLPDDIKAREQFAAFTRCVEKEPLDRWRPLDWDVFVRHLDRTVAEQLLPYVWTICKPFLGHSGSSLEPVKLIEKGQWEKMSNEEKNLYFTAYIETAYALSKGRDQTKMADEIFSCMSKIQVAKVRTSLDEVSYEWKYPLPWSVSKAFGSACQ